jgi:pilus assembly protein CpaC
MIGRGRARVRAPGGKLSCLALLAALGFSAAPLAAQQIPTAGVVVVPRGQSALLPQSVAVERVSIGDPEIADALVVSPLEVLVNGIALGTTTLIIWDRVGGRRSYTVEVTADASALQRSIQALFPQERVEITVVGNMVILTGQVRDARIARQIQALAAGTGATVVNNLVVAADQQVLLQVRIAEVSRAAGLEIATELFARNPQDIRTREADYEAASFSDGLLQLFVGGMDANIAANFRAMQSRGLIRTLAEPNLIAVDGAEATFLAGGEFPFPVAQAGDGASSRITIQWREFGVRLGFLPVIQAGGAIRLAVAPEVSSLDFTTGLVVGGFAVPSLLTRRATTTIELMEGQTFAIAGLLDNTTARTITRIPILGHIPIIGELFTSRRRSDEQMELLVLVTPWLVSPYDVPPPVPTGEVNTWPRDGGLGPVRPHPLPPPAGAGGGGGGTN